MTTTRTGTEQPLLRDLITIPERVHQGDRSRHELADLVHRHRWLDGTRFLLVPYHLIGAESLEPAILGGYVDHVRRAHPDSPLPAVYRAQGLLDDARAIRDRMGTEAFLAELPSAGDDEWGEFDSGWTAEQLGRGVHRRPRLRARAAPDQ